MLDLNLIVEIGVAGGTIALAIATFSIVRQSNLQLTELRKQNLLSSSKNEPILKVNEFKFVGNKSHSRITNIGEGRAMLIGMSMDFVPSEMTIYGETEPSKSLKFSEIIDYIEKKKQLFYKNEIKINVKFELDGKDAYPTEVINFPAKDGMKILNPNATGIFSSEMLFGMGIKFKMDTKERVFTKQAFTFDNLREYLKKYEIHKIAVDIGIIGKDLIENPTPVTRIATFFVNFKKHKTLEDAYNDALASGDQPYFFSLSQEELDWQDGDMYRHSKSQQKSEV